MFTSDFIGILERQRATKYVSPHWCFLCYLPEHEFLTCLTILSYKRIHYLSVSDDICCCQWWWFYYSYLFPLLIHFVKWIKISMSNSCILYFYLLMASVVVHKFTTSYKKKWWSRLPKSNSVSSEIDKDFKVVINIIAIIWVDSYKFYDIS